MYVCNVGVVLWSQGVSALLLTSTIDHQLYDVLVNLLLKTIECRDIVEDCGRTNLKRPVRWTSRQSATEGHLGWMHLVPCALYARRLVTEEEGGKLDKKKQRRWKIHHDVFNKMNTDSRRTS